MILPASHIDVSTSVAVKAGQGQLVACVLTGGSDTATLILQDDPDSADGTVLCNLSATAGISVQFSPAVPYTFTKGCYASLTGTASNATVVII
jgi:hypothetical protein